jgi:hypothetical protein
MIDAFWYFTNAFFFHLTKWSSFMSSDAQISWKEFVEFESLRTPRIDFEGGI